MTRRVRPIALGALAAALLVLFVCTGNVTNLVLARTSYRSEEFATRAALGASWTDLARLVFLDVVFITVLGLAAGVLVAGAALAASQGALPLEYGAFGKADLNGRGVVFAASGSVLFMLTAAAALRTRRWNPSGCLFADTRVTRTTRFALIAGQTALATVLVVGAAFLSRSYHNLLIQDSGFSSQVAVVTVLYPDDERGVRFRDDIDATVRALHRVPGVSGAAAAIGAMVDRSVYFGAVLIDGVPVPAMQKFVTSGYFEVMGTRVVAGRAFARADTATSGIVVNESFARQQWPRGSWLGKLVDADAATPVIGVAGDTYDVALDHRPAPTVFRLLEAPSGCRGDCNRVTYVLRRDRPDRVAEEQVRRAVGTVNKDAVVLESGSIGDRLAGSIRDRSFAAVMLALFAMGGAAVCAAGLISVVAFVIRRQRREIAIRIALGATPVAVLKWSLRDAVGAGIMGVLVGVSLGAWASQALQHLLYQTRAGDPVTLGVACLAMLTVVAAASGITASQALRVSPVIALRSE